MTTQVFWQSFLSFSALVIIVRCLPLELSQDTRKSDIKSLHQRFKRDDRDSLEEPATQDYLVKYGYLPPPTMDIGYLMTEDQIRDAIRNLQSYAMLPVTGEMDARTQELIKQPRCGIPDINHSYRQKRYVLYGPKWHHKNLTWSLLTATVQGLDVASVRVQLHKAFSVWAPHSSLTFREVHQNDPADIIVSFERRNHGDGFAFDGPGQVLAHAFSPGGGIGGDVHFDLDEEWVLTETAPPGKISLFSTAAHELGHSFGLSHSTVKGSLMSPWYAKLGDNYELHSDDRNGIEFLYNTAEEPVTPRWAPMTETEPTTRRSTTLYYPTPSTGVEHRPRVETNTQPYIGNEPDQRVCDIEFDAFLTLGQQVFMFKDKNVWFPGNGRYDVIPIEDYWPGLPSDLTHVDAVCSWHDQSIVFFIGSLMYMFEKYNKLIPGYPRPIYDLGIPTLVDHIDAAFRWPNDGMIYLISGPLYWKLNKDETQVEFTISHVLQVWEGVGYGVTEVVSFQGKTYFFVGRKFTKFNAIEGKAEGLEKGPPPWLQDQCPNYRSAGSTVISNTLIIVSSVLIFQR